MNTTNEVMALVDDVAGQWTDRVLEGMRAAGDGPVTIDMELETWRRLRKAVYSQISRQPTLRAPVKSPREINFPPRPRLAGVGG